ncbi:MAG: DUF4329 domain-containing protein [Rubellimicrobium sp.]|nr:DUF4329 domain-containing protein [Rubellimicrobium sp.]
MRRFVLARGAAFLTLLAALAACDMPVSGGAGQRPRIIATGVGTAIAVPAQGRPQGAVAISPQGGAGGSAAIPAAANPGTRPGTAPSSPTGDELAFVTQTLTQMQLRSYSTGSETCGYVGRDAAGQMMASVINTGQEASCYLPRIPNGMRVVASIHTHGTYSPAYASEFPTVQDMTTDARDGINGYISTPGGRLWYVDTATMSVRQLCGRGCLPQDPHYRPQDDGPVQAAYTIAELRAWEAY